MDKLLTVIIPSYNMEHYIEQCVTSLVVPGFERVEVLVMNDGSKDRTSEIAHNLEARYPNSVRCIDKPNGNYGSCVNKGLELATGKYVKVLDADDSFDNAAFARFVEVLGGIDADLVVSNCLTVDPDGKVLSEVKYSLPETGIFPVERLLPEFTAKGGSMHSLAYRTGLFRQYAYRQTEGISYTDTEWNLIPLSRVADVAFVPVTLYRYLLGREGQTMNDSALVRNLSNLIKVEWRLLDFRETDGASFSPAFKDYYDHCLYVMLALIYRVGILSGQSRSEAEMKEFDAWAACHIAPEWFRRLDDEKAPFVPGVQICFVKLWHKNHNHLLLRIRSVLRNIVRR